MCNDKTSFIHDVIFGLVLGTFFASIDLRILMQNRAIK